MYPAHPATISVRSSALAALLLRQAQSALPGLMLSAAIALTSNQLVHLSWLQQHGVSALTLSIVLGMIIGNTLYPRFSLRFADGVAVSKQSLLRLGIIGYGLRLTFQDVAQVGVAGVAIDALVLCSTFAVAMFVGIRLLRLDRDTVILIGAGSSICGAAAVMACAPVVRARSEQLSVAVSTVVVFGTLAIVVYPWLYQLNLSWQVLDNSPAHFGIYAGSTIHEVAQVVAAARSISAEVADTAVIAKMVRVMMLAPFLMLLSIYLMRRKEAQRIQAQAGQAANTPQAISKSIPWFALVFILVVGINSIIAIPPAVVTGLLEVDSMLLSMAMAALGLTTHVSAVRRAGFKPLLLAALVFFWLIVGGAVINRTLMLCLS
jgi:uncharacterized integral membrane protein (TIGR00698 family)